MQRADRFELLFKALKKHYKPVSPVSDRKVLDHLLYACCLQDATQEAADEAFAKLQQAYFDSNEIRVTTIAELSESLTSLKHAAAAASRIKKSLQAMFEARYSFDIDDLKKSNLGKAVDEITGWIGVTKFVVSYVTQHAFGGHSIPVDDSALTVCHLLDLITPAEVEKGVLPGIERAIPKTKGLEFASLLHQFAVDHATSHKNPLVVAVFKELGMTSKPKAPPPPPAVKFAKPVVPSKQPDVKATPKVTKTKPVMSIAASAAAQTAKTAAAAELAASKAKKAEAATTSKSGDSKTAKTTVAAKPAKPTKMTSPPAAAKPPTKGATSTPKPSEPASKKSSSVASNAKATTKPAEKAPAKSEAKPAAKKVDVKKVDTKKADTKKVDAKKVDAKKVDAKKPLTKNGSAAPPPKPTTKGGSSSAKPAPKKLPVKPVTQKRTKPR